MADFQLTVGAVDLPEARAADDGIRGAMYDDEGHDGAGLPPGQCGGDVLADGIGTWYVGQVDCHNWPSCVARSSAGPCSACSGIKATMLPLRVGCAMSMC